MQINFPKPIRMDQQYITLISFGYFDEEILNRIAEAVRNEFQYAVRSREAHMDLSDYFDPGRRQYNGDKLLKVVESLMLADSIKTLGLLNVDLYIPILTFIFGQAVLGGNAGIASMYRLSNERYGMPPDKNLLLDRFKKEVIHELGHTFGLIHCHATDCVMRSSTYVEDIDLKSSRLCHHCREIIDMK
jgi:archaemetzincin